jgi:endonuclease-3 related protein
MPALEQVFSTVCEALADYFGLSPGEFDGTEPSTAMIAVVLARTLGQHNGRTALDALSDAELFGPRELAGADVPEIADALAGKHVAVSYKTLGRVKQLARWLDEGGERRLDRLLAAQHSTGRLREEISAIPGIGRSSADAMLLHALNIPSYPLDRATFRVLARHGWIDPYSSYDDARDLVVHLAVEAEAYDRGRAAAKTLANLEHGMHQLGSRLCKARAPRCDGCPLERLLPEGGPRELDE